MGETEIMERWGLITDFLPVCWLLPVLRYLTIKTTQGCSTLITYILFSTKMQKGKKNHFWFLGYPVLISADIFKSLGLKNCRHSDYHRNNICLEISFTYCHWCWLQRYIFLLIILWCHIISTWHLLSNV